ncbi:hypothetical protein CPC16_004235 [Podila verticillata]|nr:hypothetical protein CPC16_004235 [Podila verticillata]
MICEPYTISNFELSGELLDKKEELLKLVKIRSGERFSAAKLQAASKAITDKLGEYGYAFATVAPQQVVDQQRHTAAISLQVTLGRRVYVRRVNVSGNNRTRDEVIRREMRQFESAWFDGQRLKLSQDRINRLGYFTDVNVAMAPVEGTNDQVDVDVKVAEKPTGAVTVGAGFSSTDKVVLSAGVSQDNVFGSGTSLAVNINTAKTYRTLSVTQVDPYFTIDGAGFEQDRMKADETAPKAYRNYIDQFGRVVNNVPLTIGWSRDSRDSALVPSRGYYTQANGELGTPAGDTQYYKIDLQQQYYYSFARGFVLGLNGQFGYGRGLAGKPYPIFKNYYAGGIGSVRGYEPSSLGPKDAESADAIGGSKLLIGNIELTFPLPKTGYDHRILSESTLAKAAQDKLKQEFLKRDQELQAIAKDLKTKSNKLDKHAATMSDLERKKAQAELTQLDADFQRKQREFSEDLNQRRNEELAAVLERANKAIKQIAEAKNYDLIVQEAVYVNPRIDITDEVLKALAKPNGNF